MKKRSFFLILVPYIDKFSWCADAERTELTPSEFDTDKDAPEDEVPSEGERTEPDVSQEETANENGGETTFSYDRLISKSTDPVRGIDSKRREVCHFRCPLKNKFCAIFIRFILWNG
jgi:hypothetical protein